MRRLIIFFLLLLPVCGFAQLSGPISTAQSYVNSNITANGSNQITGAKLNTALNNIINAIKYIDTSAQGMATRRALADSVAVLRALIASIDVSGTTYTQGYGINISGSAIRVDTIPVASKTWVTSTVNNAIAAYTPSPLNASNLLSGTIPAARYGTGTIDITKINASGGATGKVLSYDGTWITFPVTSVAGKTGAVTLVKGDVGLGNVDNTSDANKPISTATQAALDLRPPVSPSVNTVTTGYIPYLSADGWRRSRIFTTSANPNSYVGYGTEAPNAGIHVFSSGSVNANSARIVSENDSAGIVDAISGSGLIYSRLQAYGNFNAPYNLRNRSALVGDGISSLGLSLVAVNGDIRLQSGVVSKMNINSIGVNFQSPVTLDSVSGTLGQTFKVGLDGKLSWTTLALNSLSDVNIVSPINGSVLKYNSTTGKWQVGVDNVGGVGGTYSGTDSASFHNLVAVTGGFAATRPNGTADTVLFSGGITSEVDPKRVVSAAFTGTTTKTLTLTLADASTVTGSFTDQTGGAGGGITDLNGDNSSTQAFATGTSGTNFNISTASGTHTFNLPTASASNRGALSSTDWSTFNGKQNAITTGTTSQYFRGDLSLATFPTLGTAAALNVAASGNAASGEVVKGNDTRLSDSRTPTSHTHAESEITNLTTDLAAKESLLTFNSGLNRTVNTVTNAFTTGVAGGQTLSGGTAASDPLTVQSTTNATKGPVTYNGSSHTFSINSSTTFQVRGGSANGAVNIPYSSSTGNVSALGINSVWTASSGTQYSAVIVPTINQSGTAGSRDLFIARYEQALGSGPNYLIDAGTSTAANGGGTYTRKFMLDNVGNTYQTGTQTLVTASTPADPASGSMVDWYDGTAKKFKRNISSVVTTGTYLSGPDTVAIRNAINDNTTAIANKLPLSGGTMTGPITLGENTSIALDPAGSADGKYSGTTVTGTGGTTIAFGDVVMLDAATSRWRLADISVAAGSTGDARGLIGMAVTSSTNGNPITVLLHGIIRADANFPTLTVGSAVYASTTGDVVVTQPSTTDYIIRVMGFALTADEMYFNPSNDYITHN